MESGVRDRRVEELEALQAYYGSDLQRSLRDCQSAPEEEEEEAVSNALVPPLEGPWFIRIQHANVEDDDCNGNSSSLGTPTLEIRLPSSYPLGEESPEPLLHHVMMNPRLKRQLIEELRGMYEAEMDVGIMWTERCREEVLQGTDEDDIGENYTNDGNDASASESGAGSEGTRTFIPPTTRYHQPIRNFPADVISNERYRREMIRTPPFHPPKSGPSECMIAHVCSVTCMEHVQWALAELLFNDRKVAKATHNMFAYRFTSDGTLVSDNDDDGEKGSGSKLAALLDMSGVDDVLVVVSRWFGGSLLGPARFKWIASVARDGLVQGGFLKE